MSKENLNKSIDALIDDIFSEEEQVEKSIDIAKDAKTKADEAANEAPKGQKDEARGAGRPKQISDVPQTDTDGARAKEYDDAITENEGKEDQPEETKKQAKVMDQTVERKEAKAKAPEMRPFKKSDDSVEISKEEYAAFEAFKKSQAEAEVAKAKEAEELKKAEVRQEQEALIKSAVQSATEDLRKSMDEQRKVIAEQASIIKSMASQPKSSKSVTGIEQLEKSQSPEEAGPQSFSKSEIEDAIEELVIKGELSNDVMAEYQMTESIYNKNHRAKVEKYLSSK